jgi:hypothetical protein
MELFAFLASSRYKIEAQERVSDLFLSFSRKIPGILEFVP